MGPMGPRGLGPWAQGPNKQKGITKKGITNKDITNKDITTNIHKTPVARPAGGIARFHSPILDVQQNAYL